MPDNNERVVRFMYDVPILADALSEVDGVVELTEDGRDAAFEMLVDGITDTSDGWYPRHYILCGEPFYIMGDSDECTKALGHEGQHSTMVS